MSRSLINKATKDDQKAIGGPMLREIAEKSKISLQECSAIEGYLLKRLEKKSPDVKLKVLNIIKYLCVNGRDDFRISFQRNNTLIRECTHFRGPPDPLRGDAPSEKVRQAAKDTMTAIFNGGSRNTSRTHGKITGFGSNTTQDYSSNYDSSRHTSTPIHDYGTGTFSVPKIESGAYSTGRMVGYGSGGTYDPKKEQNFMDRMRSKQTKKSQPTYTFKPHVSAGPYSGPSGSGGGRGGHDPEPVMSSGRRRKKGEVGGSWGVTNQSSGGGTFGSGSSQHSYGQSNKPVQSQTYQPRTFVNRSTRSAPRETKSSPTDGAFERGLVDQMTQASGVYRSGAFKKEIQDFIKKCLSLDIDVIAQLLDEKLASPAYTTQLKAVGIIQALFDRNISDFDAAEEYFKDMPQNLLEVKKSGKTKALKDKAGKILDRLGISVEEKPSEPTPAPQHHHIHHHHVEKVEEPSSQLDILNFGGGDSTNVPDSTPSAIPTSDSTSVGEFNFMNPQPTSTSEEPTGDLFGNLTIKDTEPAVVQDVTIPSTDPVPKKEPSDPMLKFFEDSKDTDKKTQQTNSGSGNLLDDLMGTSTTQNQGSIFPNSSQQQQQHSSFGQQQPLFGQQQQQPLFGQQQPLFGQQQPLFGQQQPMQQQPMQQQQFFGQPQRSMQQQQMFGQQQLYGMQQQSYGQQRSYGQQQPMQSQMGFGQQFFTQQQQPVYGQSMQQTSQPSGFGFIDPLDTSTIQTTSSSTKKKDAFAGMVDFTKS